uniref:G domain-containing protein n=1 Tax=Amphimedon queenslandica TaxID=400682 RepID=A0A1X7TUA5_AMPQE
MATPLDDAVEAEEDDSSMQLSQDPSENLTPEMEERTEALYSRRDPVNIVVVGPAGVGKSTLINAMFGKEIAEVGRGAESVTSNVRAYEEKHMGIKMRFYDTVGFSDTKGRSEYDILLDIAEHGKFDLILICSKLENRADRTMFMELASVLNEDMWKSAIVVLTFANIFIQLENVKKSNDLEGEIRRRIDEHKASVKIQISKELPYCIAGLKDQKQLPTTEDWLRTLWHMCINHCSDERRPLLKDYEENIEAGTLGPANGAFNGGLGAHGPAIEGPGALGPRNGNGQRPVVNADVALIGAASIGAGIGATVGSVIPVAGPAIGAIVGGGFIGLLLAFLRCLRK